MMVLKYTFIGLLNTFFPMFAHMYLPKTFYELLLHCMDVDNSVCKNPPAVQGDPGQSLGWESPGEVGYPV